ncbi:hypothetical protein J7J26_00795 [Candidatus Micrarchaeota archaeon]|nr:hypothetical protein [Candidatus Micrarchaeota archaeon]
MKICELGNRKGQYFSFDAIVGLLIFIISVGILITYWYNIQQIIQTQDASTRVVALRISDMLFTQGQPSNWNTLTSIDNVKMIGLMTNGTIDPLKINKLSDFMTSDANETKLKMKTSGYDFQVILSGGYNTEIGDPPTCNTTVTTFTRIAPLNISTTPPSPPTAVDVTVRVWVCP